MHEAKMRSRCGCLTPLILNLTRRRTRVITFILQSPWPRHDGFRYPFVQK